MFSRFRGVPKKFKKERVFAHYKQKVKIGNQVKALCNVMNGAIIKGKILTIKDIMITPKANERGFTKKLIFEETTGEFNPKKFKKI